MKKSYILLTWIGFAFSLLTLPSVLAQDSTATKDTSYWTRSGSLGFNFANVGLSNWAAGGVSSISLGTIINLNADYAKGQTSWKNSLHFACGAIRQGGSESPIRKTDDNLILSSQYGYALAPDAKKGWSVVAGASLRTQVAPGFLFAPDLQNPGKEIATRISTFMAPGYILVGTGMEYNVKGTFSLRLAPLTLRTTIVNDEALSAAGAFGVEAGKKVRNQFGWSLASVYTTTIAKNVSFQNTLNLFGDYARLGVVVVNWETLIVMKVNKYLNTTFGTQLIYDHDVNVKRNDGTVGQAVQFKHVLNVGLSITL